MAGESGRQVPEPPTNILSVRIRQRLDQHSVDHAEDGRVGADSQRQRHQRDGGKRRGQPEPPEDLFQDTQWDHYLTKLITLLNDWRMQKK